MSTTPASPPVHAPGSVGRPALLRRALGLEALTIGWNLVEGVVGVAIALAAGSVALLGFGIDSFVESASGGVIVWRLLAERSTREAARVAQVERRAQRLVAASLFALAAWIAFDGVRTLAAREEPEPSVAGIVLAVVSMALMWWLARAKRRVATAMHSHALEADAFQTEACWWLSVGVLVGVGLNGLFGWWWADPVAGLAMAVYIAREARQTWRGHGCC